MSAARAATAQPVATVTSPSWDDAAPEVSVVIATHDRSAFLPELVDALAAQAGSPAYEVLIADDGSSDDTWQVLERLAKASPIPLCAMRLQGCGGPSVPRNTAAAAARAELLAFTDDDCLPTAGWLAALVVAAGDGRVVQGLTRRTLEGQLSPWDRTIQVAAPSGLWESCNLALSRSLFDQVGGFPLLDLLPESGRGFGEDAALGALAARIAGEAWAPEAVVEHRWLPGDYRAHLDGMRRLAAMPALVAQLPELRAHCYRRWFRSRRSAACDLAAVAALSAVLTRRPVVLAAALPWGALVTVAARTRWGRPLPVRAGQEAVADLIGLAALVRGNVRARTLLL